MANTEPSNATLQIRYKKGDKLDQIVLERAKKDHVKKSEAGRRLIRENPVLKQKNKELTTTVQWQREKFALLTSGTKNTCRPFPPCDDSVPITGEPSKRECIRKPQDRFVNLPKINGKFVVDNGKKCERCQEMQRLLAELEIKKGKKVTRKDVLTAEFKKNLYQYVEETAKEQDRNFTEKDEQLRKIRENMKTHLQSIKKTLADQKTMQNGRSGKGWFTNEYDQRISY